MQHLSRLFCVISLCVLFVVGCSVTIPSQTHNDQSPVSVKSYLPYNVQPKVGHITMIRDALVFQVLEKHFALADVAMYNVGVSKMVVAIRMGEDDSPMYDSRVLSGEFVMIDTYTYTTVPDEYGRTFSKTVPVVIPRADYLKALDQSAL
jgi:hypothetical protein